MLTSRSQDVSCFERQPSASAFSDRNPPTSGNTSPHPHPFSPTSIANPALMGAGSRFIMRQVSPPPWLRQSLNLANQARSALSSPFPPAQVSKLPSQQFQRSNPTDHNSQAWHSILELSSTPKLQ